MVQRANAPRGTFRILDKDGHAVPRVGRTAMGQPWGALVLPKTAAQAPSSIRRGSEESAAPTKVPLPSSPDGDESPQMPRLTADV